MVHLLRFRYISAFIKKDFLLEKSYGFAFVLNIISIFITVLIFFFINKIIGKEAILHLKPYSNDYFSFVLIGIAFSSYIGVGLNSFVENIRNEQIYGTLEQLVMTKTPLYISMIYSSLWNFLYTTIEVLIYLAAGSFMGIKFNNANVISAAVILVLTISVFSLLGIISASIILVFKKGHPINWLMSVLAEFLGGVYFPVSILPDQIQKLSLVIPLTYSLDGLRLALLKGYTITQLKNEVFALLLFIAILLPTSIVFLNLCLRKVKSSGTLSHI